MLGLWCSWRLILLVIILLLLLRLGSGFGLLGLLSLWLLLFLRRRVLQDLIAEDDLWDNSLEHGLRCDGGVPPRNVRVLFTELLVVNVLEPSGADTGSEDIGKGEALADKEGVLQQVLLHYVGALVHTLEGVVNRLLVVWVAANKRAEVATELGEQLLVGEVDPFKNRSVVLLGLAQKSGLLVLRGDFTRSALQSHELCDKQRGQIWVKFRV